MKRMMILLIIFSIVGCRKKPVEPIPPPEPKPDMTGTWFGNGVKNGISYSIQTELSQQDSIVAGSGNISAFGITVLFNVTGKSIYPDVLLFMASADSSMTGNYVGEFVQGNDNQITGFVTVNNSPFINEPLTINRIKGIIYPVVP